MSLLVPTPNSPTRPLEPNGSIATRSTTPTVTMLQIGARAAEERPDHRYPVDTATASRRTTAVETARPGSLMVIAASASSTANPAAAATPLGGVKPASRHSADPHTAELATTSAAAQMTSSTPRNVPQQGVSGSGCGPLRG